MDYLWDLGGGTSFARMHGKSVAAGGVCPGERVPTNCAVSSAPPHALTSISAPPSAPGPRFSIEE